MSFAINILLLISMFFIGFGLGHTTFKKKSWYYDVMLVLLIIVSTFIGVSTYIVDAWEVQLRMPQTLQMIFLGVLVRRILGFRLKSIKVN
ncbi:hypothetical protein [Clostridium sp. UBA4548]|uniref:hypothetical protein n=1 Tax=Clostridium sp. UBA4548 TaxID=1946361 RepID=UPI0025BDFB51|nr:hypothetical protein [Clostridium sp. UBA4548]